MHFKVKNVRSGIDIDTGKVPRTLNKKLKEINILLHRDGAFNAFEGLSFSKNFFYFVCHSKNYALNKADDVGLEMYKLTKRLISS